MSIVEERNDLGGRSYYVDLDGGGGDPKILAKLTPEERAILADPTGYFVARERECGVEPVRGFLRALSEAEPLRCEVHVARFDPGLSATYFALRLPAGAELLVGARRLPLPPGLPAWLQPVYEGIGGTREERWLVAGGFQPIHRLGSLPPLSEYAPAPVVRPADVTVFFDTRHGDSLGFLPDGRCVWYLHETEAIEPCVEPPEVVAALLRSHLRGGRVQAPEPGL